MGALRLILFGVCLLMWMPTHCMAAAWLDVTFDREVPEPTRANVGRVVDTTGELLSKYKVVLREPVQIIITADTESYIQAMMFYLKETRPVAEQKAAYSAGPANPHVQLRPVAGFCALNAAPFSVLSQ